ncbi:patatin-like phospholipase family protein [Nocardia yunnanensis]|uniref:Patatin-like phospholipase family protein n=1 Tax=Nocardia yunnanensis TaxID=2382165 RepID=A0A386ZA38_9NOCA|nr:patatin-like phospholipase family protein [Nocardia yunnanensis]AYF74438.1 patatin-like phospholipase family protein [Nocardia yunnanensis]
MSAAVPPNGIRHALVLGGGGAVGLSWMAGVVIGLREAGIEPTLAERIVGTSAGAVVGAALAAGVDLNLLLRRPDPDTEIPPIAFDPNAFGEIMAILATPGISPDEARRRAGQRALEMNVGAPADHIARIGAFVGDVDWPQRDLRITACSVGTGELRVWTPGGKATLREALACSTSVPGVFPPIPVDGDHYIDGGMRSPINADLAAGAERMLIIEPLAHLFPHSPTDRDLGGAATRFIVPDAASIEIFGLDLFNAIALVPAHEAGLRQGTEAAASLKDFWPGA